MDFSFRRAFLIVIIFFFGVRQLKCWKVRINCKLKSSHSFWLYRWWFRAWRRLCKGMILYWTKTQKFQGQNNRAKRAKCDHWQRYWYNNIQFGYFSHESTRKHTVRLQTLVFLPLLKRVESFMSLYKYSIDSCDLVEYLGTHALNRQRLINKNCVYGLNQASTFLTFEASDFRFVIWEFLKLF